MNCVLPNLKTFPTRRTGSAFALLLLFIFLAASVLAQNTISTIAGGGLVNGPATGPNADIPGPSGVTKDSQGNTYVAVPAAQQVFKIDTQGNISVFAGIGWSTEDPQKLDNRPATSASLNGPTGVVADSVGNVYIADTTDYLIRKVDTNGIMHTLAGNAHQCQIPTNFCGDNNLAAAAQLSSPVGAATDLAGNVYIADTRDNRIRVVNTQSTPIIIAGFHIKPGYIKTVAGTGAKCATPTMPCGDTGNAGLALLNNPQGVAVDAKGNIYIADSGDHRIRVVSTSGIITAYAGTGNVCIPKAGCGDGGSPLNATMTAPWQLSLDSAGDLFLVDPPEGRVREITASTNTITSVVGSGKQGFGGDGGPAISAYLDAPHGVWVDSSGNLVIGDTGNQRVRAVSQAVIGTMAGGGSGGDGGSGLSGDAILAEDKDVALDSAGNLYIADTANNRIRQLSGGILTTVAGNGFAGFAGDNGLATNANLNSPEGVAVDASGNVYFADTYNLVIREVNAITHNITTVAGIAGRGCSPTTPCGDGGPATSATFALPVTVSVDSLGNIYVADQAANRIRKIDTTGTISTIAGTGAVCGNPLSGNCGDGGPATAALLNGPFSAVADASGNVYIADTNDNRVRKVDASGNITAYAFTGVQYFGPLKSNALQFAYGTPQYLALDPSGNLYVSGSALYYVIARIDANAPGNPVAAISGKPGDPKYYGYAGDGGLAVGAELSNVGIAIDGSGHLYVADGGNDRVREIVVSAVSNVAPTGLTFPSQPVGTTSSPLTFKVTNPGSDDLTISSTSVTGDFALSPTNPCPSNQVAPGQTCTFSVTFTPTQTGTRTGKVVLHDNAYNDPTQTVYMTGTGS